MLALPHTQCACAANFEASTVSAGQACAWLRCRREERRFLTRPALRGVLVVSGRRASRKPRPSGGFDLASGGSNKGHDEKRDCNL